MRILISGASGLIGSALARRAVESGHQVVRLVRGAPGSSGAPCSNSNEMVFDPLAGRIDQAGLAAAQAEAVVHLAGENIAAGRWTAARMARIRQSRVQGTRLLAETLAALPAPPKVLACASAVGYYGNRGDAALDETSPGGAGFLAEVCREWEAATEPAARAGVRVVSLRFGMVLAASGGALAKMLPPFRLGLGGPIGSGRQYVSWISRDDAVSAILSLVADSSMEGAVNLTAPQPVTNREFARTLGRVLRRPAFLPLPSVAARLLLGKMADELLLSSAQVFPRRLLAAGFAFRDPQLEPALERLLGVR